MAKHRHNKPHGEPDDEPVDDTGSIEYFGTVPTAPPDEPEPAAVPQHAAHAGPIPHAASPNPHAAQSAAVPHVASPNPAAGAVPPVPLKAVPMHKATVTMPGCPPVEVEYPADTPEPARHAAVKGAYMAAVGQWALPAEPHIDLHD